MNKHVMPKLTRRGFVIGTAAAGAGLAIGLDLPFGGPTVVRAADGSPEVNVWVVIRPDDTDRDSHRPLGDGPGHPHRPRPARRRRARMRLVEGRHRISDAGSKCRTQARLGRFLDRRQPRHPHQPGICPQGRRHRARDADPGRRQRVEGAGLGMHRRQQRHHPHAVGQDHDLRQGGGSRRQARAAGRRQAEGSQGLEDRRQGRQAARYRSTRPPAR